MSLLLYNPQHKEKNQLKAEFVVRTQVYDTIMHDLETAKMKHPEQHYLLVGQRGAGKTTLLNRIKYGIEDSPKLNSWLLPVLFTEEQYHLSELANLWESIAQYLEDYHDFAGLSAELEKHLHKSNFEELAFDLLENYLSKYQKKLVLLIDNIGDLLKKLDKTEVHRLREVLQTKKEIRLIAGSPFYLESVLDYQQPLFEFFKVIRLEGLNQQETEDLLLKLSEIHVKKAEIERIIKETPERIYTLRTLTGGVPRTIALMFTIFIEYNDEGSVKDLEKILDAVTPLYKHRMDDLPTQQQKIVDAVAKSWDAISVKELKEKVRIDGKIISAQLRQLEKDQVIEKKETGTKNHLYLLKERFFNIWYLMRYGRKDDRQRVIWLVKFLESWCSSSDLNIRVLDYVKKISSGALDDSTKELFGQVYAALGDLNTNVKFLLKESVPKTISRTITISENELYYTLFALQEKENWPKILQIVLNEYYPSFRIKKLILVTIISIFKENLDNEIVNNVFRNIFNKNLPNNSVRSEERTDFEVTEVELHICRCILWAHIQYNIFQGNLDEAFALTNSYFLLLNNENFNESRFEYMYLYNIFSLILAHQHYNLMYKIFNKMKDFNLVEVFRPVYFALVLLAEGKDSQEFLKAGPELQEVVKEIIKEVNTIKKEYKILIKNKI